MLWCHGSSAFFSEVAHFESCQETADGTEAARGDRLVMEVGDEGFDPRIVTRATARGVTAIVCGRGQLALLLGREEPPRLSTSVNTHDDDVDLDAWRAQHAPEIIGRSSSLKDALEMAERVARFDCPVLITGESGTGKELLARAIHRASPRNDKPFVPVNCPAIPKDLVESELFGHAKGAFTGAVSAREGRFVTADGGTLFLDEIGETDLDVQRKLLRVLQDFTVTPVGESRARRVDVRIVAATNRDLEAMSESGEFRLDLLFRLNVVQIHLPALRDRPEDVEELFAHHLEATVDRLGVPAPIVSEEIHATLRQCAWPGNIRQLRNIVERLVILRAGHDVRARDLPNSLSRGNATTTTSALGQGNLDLPEDGMDLRATLGELEDRMIRQAILATSGNKNQAARLLGLNRTTLVEKLKKRPDLQAA